MTSLHGGKRSIGSNEAGGAEQPSSKAPRLSDRTEPTCNPSLVLAPAAAFGSNADLLCHIGCMMDTGETLYNLCVSVGPKVAAKIRHKYLRKNEAYVVKCLKRLEAIPELKDSWWNFTENLPLFDKCRDNIQAWMAVNSDWRTRISLNNILRYKGDVVVDEEDSDSEEEEFVSRIRLEPNVVFNNIAVAVEIGLGEVVHCLVEDYNIDVCASEWTGFNNNCLGWNDLPLVLAMLRGDANIAGTLLSSAKFTMEKAMKEDLFGFMTRFSATPECAKRIITHPNVDPNYVLRTIDGRCLSPLLCALSGLHTAHTALRLAPDVSNGHKIIAMLLEGGADPDPSGVSEANSPLARVKAWLDKGDEVEGLHTLLDMLESKRR